jgi:pimeloyl-ACP methyl ester carboxylesterase
VALLLFIPALVLVNMAWVDGITRAAAPRDGGRLVATPLVEANVRVEGEGPPIVLIHGFAASLGWWDEIAPDLAKDHTVVRLDLIGHGGTAAPATGYTIADQAQLVAAVLDSLKFDRVTVIGHSMGGEVATALAEANPARIARLILIDSPPEADTDFTVLTELYLTRGIGELLSHFQSDAAIRSGLAQGFAPGFPVPQRFVDDLRQLTYTAFRAAHDASVAYRREKATYARLAALGPVPPLLAIAGAADAIVPVTTAKLYEKVPGAKVEILDGVGHTPMVEAPGRTLALIRAFLP